MQQDQSDTIDRTTSDPNEPLFSLPMDEGAGTLIGAAAGDVAGGSEERGYSAITQVATVTAYHLLTNGSVDRDMLQTEILQLAGIPEGTPSFRGATEEFDTWLSTARNGQPTVSADASSEPAARIAPVGVWFRRDPDGLVASSIAASRLTHLDATTAVAAAAVAGAIAGSCFVQAGVDLVFGAAETADRALANRPEGSRRGFVNSLRSWHPDHERSSPTSPITTAPWESRAPWWAFSWALPS